MVSAAKLRRAQDAIIRMRPYASKLYEILQNLTGSLEGSAESIYSQQREIKRILIVLVTSNRGLCGAFNSNVNKLGFQTGSEKYPVQWAAGNVEFAAIGKKASDFVKGRQKTLATSYNEVYDNLTFDTVAPVAVEIMQQFAEGKYDRVELVYNQFKSAAVQRLICEQFLPVKQEKPENDKSAKSAADYIYEPGQEEIVSELIPKSLKIQFYKALLDSHASEHGARMTAMHKATDNANELLRDLKLWYNKERQASITGELLEIVAGAAALEG